MSVPSKVFFTSDTHFGHENIIEFCKRPFDSVKEMDKALIDRWNGVVSKHDMVFHLGDFCFGNEAYWRQIRERLNGQIALIKGNHDRQVPKSLFAYVKDYHEVTIEHQKIVLFHYGMRTWHHDLRGTWHLYGHSHGDLPPYGKSCDVGVDCYGYTPVEFSRLKIHMDRREIGQHPQWANYTPVQ